MTRRTREKAQRGRSLVGERYTVDVGPVAHGGHCVARHEGRVVFVRHSLPGERVVAQVTEGDEGSKFLRADAVEILSASSERVEPPCPFSGPGRCGGCDFQHVALPTQRELKAAVVREQLQRLAKIDVDVSVEAVPGDEEGLGWRTRVQFAVDRQGYAGLRKYRSHEVVRVDHCPISHSELPGVTDRRWADAQTVEAIRSSTGEGLLIETTPREMYVEGQEVLHERAAGRVFEVTGSGFWQVHPGAAEALLEAVVSAVEPRPGEAAADLYSGVGLFSASLAERVGRSGRVVAVESDVTAVEDAARNLAGLPQVEVATGRVEQALREGVVGQRCDVVVLDPPRVGAKREVVEAVVSLDPRAVAYVACDPGALARDVAIFAENGYRLTSLRAFDIFPMTHHVECVALLVPAGAGKPDPHA
ncbi:MAG TPA: class I SAM-dependent RNA methyltransferase [Nocardioidaceae bacterium]|nr:class I SAM-dependent RNA methyltransferase [Nocardioidaceae bacterium]